ncbi:hypothetical protein D6779_05060 [Candidatus Parcubacteria bacterium]|nr:MAG: hypothetical protein D6779_05060 [Candidatus Parcubacteria bacterium]
MKVKTSASGRMVMLVAVCVPLVYYLTFTWVYPRPYYLQPADLEQDYYYNSRLILSGLPPKGVHHPGTPVHYLGAAILSFVGTDISRAQTFFDIGYLTIGIFSALGLGMLARVVLVNYPLSISVCALALLVVHPAFLSYSNQFGADAFIVPVGTMLLAALWKAIEQSGSERYSRRWWFIGAMLAGLALAIKLTFLPVVAAMLATRFVGLVASRKSPTQRVTFAFGELLIFALIILVSFVVFTIPVLNRFPGILINLLHRHEAVPPTSLKRIIWNWLPILQHPYWFLYFFYTGLAIVGLGIVIISRYAQLRKQKVNKVDKVVSLKTTFLLISTLLFMYTCATVQREAHPVNPWLDPGVMTRNILPSALFLPFVLLYIYDFFREQQEFSTRTHNVFSLIGLIIFIVVFGGYVTQRSEFIDGMRLLVNQTQMELRKYASEGKRIAFWDGSPGNLLGEASFHYWGDYNYAHDLFDEELLSNFPDYTLFRLREVPAWLESPPGDNENDNFSNWYYTWWQQHVTSPYFTPRVQELFIGERKGIAPAVFAFPKRELRGKLRLSDVLGYLDRIGEPQSIVETSIGPVQWIIVLMSYP